MKLPLANGIAKNIAKLKRDASLKTECSRQIASSVAEFSGQADPGDFAPKAMRKVTRWPTDPAADVQNLIADVDLKLIGDFRLYASMTGIDTVLRQRCIQTVAEIASAVMPGNVEIGVH